MVDHVSNNTIHANYKSNKVGSEAVGSRGSRRGDFEIMRVSRRGEPIANERAEEEDTDHEHLEHLVDAEDTDVMD